MTNHYENNLKAFYKDAVVVQNASNIIGVINSFLDGVKAVRSQGIDPRNDPGVKAFLFKIMDMVGYPDINDFMNALKQCEEMVKHE